MAPVKVSGRRARRAREPSLPGAVAGVVADLVAERRERVEMRSVALV